MKKTQGKDAFRNIKKRIVSYLSICLVIMLGLGGTFITRYMGAGINAEATGYYNDHEFKNYEIISSLGITDDDIAQIKETKGITDAEGVIRSNASFTKGPLSKNVEVVSMTDKISVPEVIEGNIASAKDECMVAEDFAAVGGIKVGDKVKIIMPNVAGQQLSLDTDIEEESSDEDADTDAAAEEEEEDDILYTDTFTVTGLIKHPDYIRRLNSDVVALPMAAFDKEVTGGYYTHAFIKAEEPEKVDIFSDKYFDETADTRKELEKFTVTLADDAAARAKKKANEQIDIEWANAEAELDNAQAEIDSGEAQLNSELAKARNKLNSAQAKLNRTVRKYQKQIKEGKANVKEARDTVAKIDKALPGIKKENKKLHEQYEGSIEEALKKIAAMEKALKELEKIEDITSSEYAEAIEALAQLVLDHKDTILKVRDFFRRDGVVKTGERIKEITDGDIDLTKTIKALGSFDAEGLIGLADKLVNFDPSKMQDAKKFIDSLKKEIDSIKDSISELDEIDSYIKKYEDKRSEILARIDKEDQRIKDGEKKLAREKKKYQAQIRHGWSMYYSQKSQYEQKLAEAIELLAENREKAEEKLAEARAEVDKIECKCLLFDRRANAGYVDMKSNLAAVQSAGLVFGILFMLISAIVCFSTLTIIIDEQKKMVGTVKAFGFLKGEVLGKYLVFGVSAAIAGCIAGILIALGLSGIVLKAYDNSGMYQFGLAKSIITPGITIIVCLAMIAVCALATVIACSDILKSPASILMKGGTSKKGGSAYRKESSSRSGSLYSKLIIRNMLDDKVRVAISIIIIAFSTLLVGTGISMKLAFDGMSDKQVSDVYKYDVRVDLGEKVTDADKKKIEDIMAQNGAEYMSASYETHIFKLGDRFDALYVLTGNAEKLPEYFAVNDAKTGDQLQLPKDGVLSQKKMKESYDMGTGANITVLDSSLDEKTASVKGVFNNYVGRLVITSPDGYRKVFGEDPTFNCYYVKAGEAGLDKLQSEIGAVNSDISFEVAKEFAKKFETASLLYNLIVYVTTGIAILMSFMILSNLANIFLNRKKTELTVMRINGFSIKQTKGYLSKETIVTTAVGIALGVLVGAVMAPIIIKTMEQPDLQFVRTFHPLAWGAAAVLEALFSVVINSTVFRKVKDLDFRDIA